MLKFKAKVKSTAVPAKDKSNGAKRVLQDVIVMDEAAGKLNGQIVVGQTTTVNLAGQEKIPPVKGEIIGLYVSKTTDDDGNTVVFFETGPLAEGIQADKAATLLGDLVEQIED